MDLETLGEYLRLKEREFEEDVSANAYGVTLEDVIKEVDIEEEIKAGAFNLGGTYSNYKVGEDLKFISRQGLYIIDISNQRITLRGPYGVTLKEFEGKEVALFYEGLSSKIQKVQDEEELPF